MSLASLYEVQIMQLTVELRERECALIELGRESAKRFDDGHSPSGTRVQSVLTELRKLAERWDRLTVTPAASDDVAQSPLDELRAKRAARGQ